MFAFLKSPPDAPPITDKQALDERYRYWRRHILLTIWLGYALFYFTRKSFNAAVPEILASNVLTRSDIGLLATPVLHHLRAIEVFLPVSSATALMLAILWGLVWSPPA
ncbi:regulatory protein UhpC [Klebsiella oxytoca]|nr:regulatory protein UhpC [Klebsiella oxytoca]